VKVRAIIKVLERDGWYGFGTREAIVIITIQRSQAP
jgi:hypothetical protein